MLSPVLPELTNKIYNFLDIKTPLWKEMENLLLGKKIRTYEPLLMRIDPEKIKEIKEKSKEEIWTI